MPRRRWWGGLFDPPVIAQQKVATARRKRLAFEQEYAVIEMLEADGWTRMPSRLIDQRAAVPPKHFMHKTRFASGPTEHQEVDVACGLSGTYVLAMECKSTNDETNSVKRINDVLEKASALKRHWGAFVMTAALLQGVIAPKDVQRLTDAGVEFFGRMTSRHSGHGLMRDFDEGSWKWPEAAINGRRSRSAMCASM